MKKTFYFFLFLLVLTVLLQSFTAQKRMRNGVLELLNIPHEEAHSVIGVNLLEGALDVPSSFKRHIVVGKDVAKVTRDLGAYMKAYCASEEFKSFYATYREEHRPKIEAPFEVGERKQELLDQIDTFKQEKKAVAKEYAAPYDEAIAELEKEYAILNNPSHPDYPLYTGTAPLSSEEQKGFDESVKEFDQSYPEDVQLLIKNRLKLFLDLTSSIPFDAKLKKNNKGLMVFEDPNLERKSRDFKKCFRAGPEAIGAARAFAKEWLMELN